MASKQKNPAKPLLKLWLTGFFMWI